MEEFYKLPEISHNRLLIFNKHQLPNQDFEVYQEEMLATMKRCDMRNLRGPKLLAYLIFKGITDTSLIDAILREVKGDDTKVTLEIMESVARTQTIISTFKKLDARRAAAHVVNNIGNDNNSGKKNGNCGKRNDGNGKRNDGNGKNNGGKKNRGGRNPNSSN